MPLNASIVDASLGSKNTVQVLALVSVTGFDNLSYEGQLTATSNGASDSVDVSGQVGPGAGDEFVADLNLGLTDQSLPTQVTVTLELDDGTQDEATFQLGETGGVGDALSDIPPATLLGVGAGAVGIGLYLASRN